MLSDSAILKKIERQPKRSAGFAAVPLLPPPKLLVDKPQLAV